MILANMCWSRRFPFLPSFLSGNGSLVRSSGENDFALYSHVEYQEDHAFGSLFQLGGHHPVWEDSFKLSFLANYNFTSFLQMYGSIRWRIPFCCPYYCSWPCQCYCPFRWLPRGALLKDCENYANLLLLRLSFIYVTNLFIPLAFPSNFTTVAIVHDSRLVKMGIYARNRLRWGTKRIEPIDGDDWVEADRRKGENVKRWAERVARGMSWYGNSWHGSWESWLWFQSKRNMNINHFESLPSIDSYRITVWWIWNFVGWAGTGN